MHSSWCELCPSSRGHLSICIRNGLYMYTVSSLIVKETGSFSVQCHIQVHQWCIVHKQYRLWMYLDKMYPVELEIKDTTESNTDASYLDLLSIEVNFRLPFITNAMISISISQTFYSWVVTFHFRPPMAFSFHKLYDIPRLMNVLSW